MPDNLILDFDSTIVADEIMETFFKLALENDTNKAELIAKVEAITKAGMNGEIQFSQSLEQRLQLLPFDEQLLQRTINELSGRISPTFAGVLPQLLELNTHIISGGFAEIIEPLMKPLGFPINNIHANKLVMTADGLVSVDKSSPLAGDKGKVATVKQLQLQGQTIVVGDGYSDFQVKEAGLAQTFIYYGEHILRDKVQALADMSVSSFSELAEVLERPVVDK